jgi:EAL domain-containing protein (putative c-di-GMP-specific phosphodiesterase class I)
MSESLLDRLLAPGALTTLFQPIVEVGDSALSVHCFEALTRGPAGNNFERADVLFDYVRLRHQEAVIDRACVALACAAARALPRAPALSLNVHAITLSRDPEFLVFLSDRLTDNGIEAERLILEIVEYAPHLEDSLLHDALDALRHIGARIALDDVGMGHSNYRMMVDLAPDYFKLDRHIIQRCYSDFRRRAVLESVALLAERTNVRVVAEGVENVAELAIVRASGISLVQGHLFSPALPARELSSLDFRDPMPHRPAPSVSAACA